MMKSILGVLLLMSFASADYVRDDANGVVKDTSTSLIWQDDIASVERTWSLAIDYCEALGLGGYDDWRLPNSNELSSLADRNRTTPAIDPAFTNVVSNYYWSSTPKVGSSDSAWFVNFVNGNDSVFDKATSLYVRCVRGGQ